MHEPWACTGKVPSNSNDSMILWCYYSMFLWAYDSIILIPWFYNYTILWFHGPMILWFHDSMILWFYAFPLQGSVHLCLQHGDILPVFQRGLFLCSVLRWCDCRELCSQRTLGLYWAQKSCLKTGSLASRYDASLHLRTSVHAFFIGLFFYTHVGSTNHFWRVWNAAALHCSEAILWFYCKL